VIGGWCEALRYVRAKRLNSLDLRGVSPHKAMSTYEIGDLGFTCGFVRKDGQPATGIGCSAKASRIGRAPRIKNA
jgi:hypothetical protein